MTSLDLILDTLQRDPRQRVTLLLRIFVREGITIAGRQDMTVAKQLDLWAHTHGLLCVQDGTGAQFTFSVKEPDGLKPELRTQTHET